MQITINTNDILGDETTIREEVIAQVVNSLCVSMRKESYEILQKLVNEALIQVVQDAVQVAVDLHLDTPFQERDEYGRVKSESSVRDRIADIVQKQCTFKVTGYSSDRNVFTNTILKVVEAEVGKFQKEFNSLVTKQVVEQSADEALRKLKSSLGIK